MIRTKNLTKKFQDVTAVDNLNLDIAPGEIFGFLGPNGAGKTTSIKLLTGLLKPTTGESWIGGHSILKNPRAVKKVIALVPDQPYVYPQLTGTEFLRFVADLYEVPWAHQKKKIPELLELFELSEQSDEAVETYSHGMRQKLVLASVLLRQPEVLFLDEPMVGLDPKSARILKDIFRELSRRGVTLFICTHVLEIAEKICHRIGIVQKGRLIHMGTAAELERQAQIKGPLEDVFLHLTGGDEYRDLLKYMS